MDGKLEGPAASRGQIDTTFDFRSDTPEGADPDAESPTLKRYHKLLWSKALPGGEFFTLDDTRFGAYLYHRSDLGEFWLGSDAVTQTFLRWTAMRDITGDPSLPENKEFYGLGYTIGGMMVFPGNMIDRLWTINQARGMLSKIADRMDLTLECIRRFYAKSESPLSETISRYSDFFALFETSPATSSSSSCRTWSTQRTTSGSSHPSSNSTPLVAPVASRSTARSVPTPSSSSTPGIDESPHSVCENATLSLSSDSADGAHHQPLVHLTLSSRAGASRSADPR